MGSIYEGAVRILDKEGHELSAASAHHFRPLISVVTPTHNRIELLTRTLRSLAGQEGVSAGEYEVIVVVDGDYDRSG